MSNENKEEILANFQACTGIEDVGEALVHLEECDWNLYRAINRVVPEETQTLPTNSVAITSRLDDDIEMLPENSGASVPSPLGAQAASVITFGDSVASQVVAATDFYFNPAASASSSKRLLNFTISYNERNIELKIPDDEPVSIIKTLLYAEVGVPTCKQELVGWRVPVPRDNQLLKNLNLPKENQLYLFTPDTVETPPTSDKETDSDISTRLGLTFKLNIVDVSSGTDYSLNFPGTQTVGEIKSDVYNLTDIPQRLQEWEGWPPDVENDDSLTLAATSMKHESHELKLRRRKSSPQVKQKSAPHMSSDSSADEFEDASEGFNMEEDLFLDDGQPKLKPLMPESIEDETSAAIHFSEEFANRFGPCHPLFYQANLEEALKEALMKPAKERKLLALYLHHDASVMSNVFCTQLLCAEAIVTFLSDKFLVWGWDLTSTTNKNRLLASITEHFGSVAATTIRNMDVDKLPVILIITKTRGTCEVYSILPGSIGIDELMTSLMNAVDMFTESQSVEIQEEEERNIRETVKREQDEAYLQSLAVDRAKEEAKKAEEEERIYLEEQIERSKEQDQIEKQEKEAAKLAIRNHLSLSMPVEPAAGGSDSTHLRIRTPDGQVLSRRFLITHTLQDVLNFLIIKEYSSADYKVLTSYPRRDLTSLAPDQTLHALKLYPQETLILEER